MDSAGQVLADSNDVSSSQKTTKDSVDDMELGKSSRQSSEDGLPPFNRTRSFKTKQLVRSQAINESHSPPRQPSPRPGERVKIAKKKSASVDFNDKDTKNISASMKNLVIADKDQDRSVSPNNNNNIARTNMNLTKQRDDVSPGKHNKQKQGPQKAKSIAKVDFHHDADNEASSQSSSDSRKTPKKQDTPITEIDDNKKGKRNSDEFVRRIPSKQDSGISCWESFNCYEENASMTVIDDYSRIREEGDHFHQFIENCGCTEKIDKWTNKKTGTTLTVTRVNSSGNPRLMRKQSSSSSFDSGLHSMASPYMSRDNSYDFYSHKQLNEKLDLSSFIKEILNKNYRDRMTMLMLEREMIALIRDPNRREHSFPCSYSYGRLLIHRCAEVFGLEHNLEPVTKLAIVVSKPFRGPDTVCRIPSLSPFSQWCTTQFPPFPNVPDLTNPLPAKSILKRDAHSLDEEGIPPSNRLSQTTRSKSFEQREEEYEKVRRRIFSSPGRNESEQPWDWEEGRDDEIGQNEFTKPKLLIARPDEKQGRLLKVQSLEQYQDNVGGARAPAVSKAHSFGGYGGRQNSVQSGSGMKRQDSITSTHSAPPHTILSRHGEAARNSWLSPGSSGYKTYSGRTDSVTPSPTATPIPANDSNATNSNPSEEESVKPNVLWVVTDMSNVPPGAVIIHPQTGQALTNSDGSLYHFDPEKPPHSALLQMSQLSVENGKEKRRSRLEKQQAMLSPGIDTDHLSPIDNRLLPDSREYSPIKSPKSEQCDPIMEDDFSVSDISSHSNCQCCRDEHIPGPIKQDETQFVPPPNIPQQKYLPAKPDEKIIETTNNAVKVPNNEICVYNPNVVKNQPETLETCNECINIERQEEGFNPQPLYCDENEGRFYKFNMPPNPHCCEQQFNEHNTEIETYQVRDPMHFNIRSPPGILQLPNAQVMYGVTQEPGVAYAGGPNPEIIYSGQIMYPQSYRIQESEVHNQYQVPHQMLVSLPKPQEHEVPNYVAYPSQVQMDARTSQLQHLSYQVQNWNYWPQMAVYNQPAPSVEEPVPKMANPSNTPNSYVPVQGDPSMAIPQVFYQHPANLIPQQHTQYVYNQPMPMSVLQTPGQSQYSIYPAYPPQPTHYSIPPPGFTENQTSIKSPDKASVAPPPSKSPKMIQQPSSNTPSLPNTPLNEYPQEANNYLPYYMQQNASYSGYYHQDYNVENNQYSPYQTQKDDYQNYNSSTPQDGGPFNFIQKNQIESGPKTIQDDPQKIIKETKKMTNKNPIEPLPDVKNKTTQSDYSIPNVSTIQTHPVRVITPQGDIIKYNNPNAKLQNFQFDKNTSVERVHPEKKEVEKKPPVMRTEAKDGILGSPDGRYGWPRYQQQQHQQQQHQQSSYNNRDFKTYHNFPRNLNRNPNKKYSRERSPNVFERPPSYDVPSSPLQRTSPASHWNMKNQNEKSQHMLQRSQSLNQSTQSPPLLPFPTSPGGILPSLYHMRAGYNSQFQRRNPRQMSPLSANNLAAASNLGLMQAAALQTQSQQEMFYRQFPWLRRAAVGAPLLGPAPSLMGTHGRQRLPRPGYHHQQQQNLYR